MITIKAAYLEDGEQCSCFQQNFWTLFVVFLFLLEHSANERSNKTKKPTLLGDGCVEICLNEVMSPSPGELLFDASAQSPPSDKTVEMLHFS